MAQKVIQQGSMLLLLFLLIILSLGLLCESSILSCDRIVDNLVNKVIQDLDLAQELSLGYQNTPGWDTETPSRDRLSIVERVRELRVLLFERVHSLAK